MNLHQAKDILSKCKLLVIHNDTLDTEYTWIELHGGTIIADGYKGGKSLHVSFTSDPLIYFENRAALELMECYKEKEESSQSSDGGK